MAQIFNLLTKSLFNGRKFASLPLFTAINSGFMIMLYVTVHRVLYICYTYYIVRYITMKVEKSPVFIAVYTYAIKSTL